MRTLVRLALLALLALPSCKKDPAPSEAPSPVPSAPRLGLGAPRAHVLPAGELGAFACSEDGKSLAVGDSSGTVWWWSGGSKSWSPWRAHTEAVLEAALSEDGRLLATAGADNRLILWDTTAGKLLHSIAAHDGDIKALALSADGKRAATGGVDDEVRVWDTATGKRTNLFSGHTSSVYALLFSADRAVLWSAGRDATVRRWTFDDAEAVVSEKLPNTVSDLTLTAVKDPEEPEARIEAVVAMGLTGHVAWLDAESLATLATREVGNGRLAALAPLPDGTLVVGELTGELSALHADPGAPGLALPPFAPGAAAGTEKDPITGVRALPEGVAIALEHSLRFLPLPLPASGADGATAKDPTVPLGPQLPLLGTPARSLARSTAGFAVVSRGRVFVVSPDGVLKALPPTPSEATSIAFSGTRLIVGLEDGRVTASKDLVAWDTLEGEPRPHYRAVARLAAHVDAVVSAGARGGIRVLEPDTLAVREGDLAETRADVVALELSPSGAVVVSAHDDGTVIGREVDTRRITWTRLGRNTTALSFAPKGHAWGDGDVIGLVEQWNKVVLYDLTARAEVATLEGQKATIVALDIHPVAPVVATLDEEHVLRLWSTTNGARLAEASAGAAYPEAVLFDPAGANLATAALSPEGGLRVFAITGR